MIVLPTRRRLERRRDMLYEHLWATLQHASAQQVEHVFRQIHIINIKLITYFIREGHHEAEEIFDRD